MEILFVFASEVEAFLYFGVDLFRLCLGYSRNKGQDYTENGRRSC